MIKVDRSRATCPSRLTQRGEEDLVRLRGLDPSSLTSGDFDRAIYGNQEVKTALWQMQHGKCCFCEQDMERRHSDVEHFRPKSEAKRDGVALRAILETP
ncbi:MAG: hypothetical protein ACJ75H_13750 [Thermoanaerobaculia bacterium]